MSLNNIGQLFTKNSAPVLLSELLSDLVPRSTKQIHEEISISNIAQVAKRANEVLIPNGLEIRTQLHPKQKGWFWLMTELSENSDIKKAQG